MFLVPGYISFQEQKWLRSNQCATALAEALGEQFVSAHKSGLCNHLVKIGKVVKSMSARDSQHFSFIDVKALKALIADAIVKTRKQINNPTPSFCLSSILNVFDVRLCCKQTQAALCGKKCCLEVCSGIFLRTINNIQIKRNDQLCSCILTLEEEWSLQAKSRKKATLNFKTEDLKSWLKNKKKQNMVELCEKQHRKSKGEVDMQSGCRSRGKKKKKKRASFTYPNTIAN